MSKYDMNVNEDTLTSAEQDLIKINENLILSIQQMELGLKRSENYLSGKQFDIAKRTSMECMQLVNDTNQNIEFAVQYLRTLQQLIKNYNKCSYKGDNNE